MRAAIFQTPFIDPKRSPREVFSWAVDQAVVADQAGMEEYWLGEHAVQSWESIPNPELVIAAAALQTERVKLAPGAHLLPYHQPGSLALQVSWLSHVTEGRYILGVGAGAYPDDAIIRGIRDMSKNHAMEIEAIEILERIWKDEEFWFEGEFWNAGLTAVDPHHPRRSVAPYGGKVTVGVTGLSAKSPSIQFAGERGYLPLSVYSGDEFVKQHWDTYSTAASASGHSTDRALHHVVRDVFVADTDAEAKRLATEGGMGQAWSEYLLPVYKRFGILGGLVKDPNMDPNDIDVNYLAEHVWLVGSPDTVREKLSEFSHAVGGFGVIMPYSYDYIDNAAAWNESQRLLVQEVLPGLDEPADAALASATA